MKSLKRILGILSLCLIIMMTVNAQESSYKNLKEAFDTVDIYPYDYKGKFFSEGTFYDSPDTVGQIYKQEGKIFIPVRMILQDQYRLDTHPSKSNTLIISAHDTNDKIELEVDSKKALVNGKVIQLIENVRKIKGTTVLSLEDVNQLFGVNGYIEDELFILSPDPIELKSDASQEVLKKVKKILIDSRRENLLYTWGVTRQNNRLYYVEQGYNEELDIYETCLYMKEDNQVPKKINLPGNVKIYDIEDAERIWFTSTTNEKSSLYAYMLSTGKVERVCPLTEAIGWKADDGWISSIKKYNEDYYVIIHFGDLTMGGESIYRIRNQKIEELASDKYIGNWEIQSDKLYYTNFEYNWDEANNLFEIDLLTGEKRNLGEEGFAYNIYREISEEHNRRSVVEPFITIEDKIYTLGYISSDENSKSSVYAIDLKNNTQQKLTVGASRFWIVQDTIYYQDSTLGYLVRCDLDGANKKTLISQNLKDIAFHNGNIYYTLRDKNDKVLKGIYKYNIASGTRVKVSNHKTEDIIINDLGIYYVVEGYDAGIYKMTDQGNVCLVQDIVMNIKDTGKVILYSKRYERGVYYTK